MFASRPLAAAVAITRKVVPLADRVLVRKIEQVQKVRLSDWFSSDELKTRRVPFRLAECSRLCTIRS
jgi:hypothetical protein